MLLGIKDGFGCGVQNALPWAQEQRKLGDQYGCCWNNPGERWWWLGPGEGRQKWIWEAELSMHLMSRFWREQEMGGMLARGDTIT